MPGSEPEAHISAIHLAQSDAAHAVGQLGELRRVQGFSPQRNNAFSKQNAVPCAVETLVHSAKSRLGFRRGLNQRTTMQKCVREEGPR